MQMSREHYGDSLLTYWKKNQTNKAQAHTPKVRVGNSTAVSAQTLQILL